MRFGYKLVNAEHLSNQQRESIEGALAMKAYVCQQEFEKLLDKYHQINVLADAADEAFVSKIEFDNDECYVELDCSKVVFLQ